MPGNEDFARALLLAKAAPTALPDIDFDAPPGGLASGSSACDVVVLVEGTRMKVLTNTSSLTRGDTIERMALIDPQAVGETFGSQIQHMCVAPIRQFRISSASGVLTNPFNYKERRVDVADAVAFSNVGEIATVKAREPFTGLLDYLEKFFVPGYGPQLAARLRQLGEDLKGDYEGAVEISVASASYLVSFLEKNRQVKRPSLSATPTGTIVAHWREGREKLVTAHFLADGRLNFVVAFPNPRHAAQRVRLTGNTTSDAFFETARLENYTWVLR